jgi:transposase
MSTSLLYHAFGVRGYEYSGTEFEQGKTYFRIRCPREQLRCAHCRSRDVSTQGKGHERVLHTLPIGSRPTLLKLHVPRLWCFACGQLLQTTLDFAEPRKSYTKSFERYALELSRRMTIQDVADHLQVSWDLVKDIQKRNLQKRFGKPKLSKLKRIAIDEIAVGKGHRYMTVVLNLLSGVVVYVGEGKGAEALTAFWRQLRRAHAKVEAVATDLSSAYIAAVRENLSKAVHVFDHFHVIKLFNEKLSALRRQLFHELSKDERELLKGVRWLLLKNPENLDDTKDERQRLMKALTLNEPLAMAYYLKEDLRQFWSQENKAKATRFLEDWIARAQASGVRMLKSFAKTLQTHRGGLLAYYDCRISTGPLEGVNNKIKTMKRQAYGFRDKEFFKLKILGIHETKHRLVG